MPLVINDETNHKEEVFNKVLKDKANSYLDSIKNIQEIEFIFLKSCAYYESLVNDIFLILGFSKDFCETRTTIFEKIDILKTFIFYKPIEGSFSKYKDVANFRNRIAHNHNFNLKKDYNYSKNNFLNIEKDLSDIQIKENLLNYFSGLYYPLLFIIVGFESSDEKVEFLKFNKKL